MGHTVTHSIHAYNAYIMHTFCNTKKPLPLSPFLNFQPPTELGESPNALMVMKNSCKPSQHVWDCLVTKSILRQREHISTQNIIIISVKKWDRFILPNSLTLNNASDYRTNGQYQTVD